MPIRDGTEARQVRAAWEARRFTVEEGTRVLVAFLDAVPFETWEEHFIRELPPAQIRTRRCEPCG